MVELGRPNETFRVAVTGGDLQGPLGIGTLYKFHGCANRAIANEAEYRPLLVAREAAITHWAQNQRFQQMREQLRALIARARTLMVGLSGQDTNIQQLFGANGWVWNSVPAPVVFAAQELSEGQKSILEGAYQGDYEANRDQIRTDATLPAFGKPFEQTSSGSPDAEILALERGAATIGSEYGTWLNGPGAQITQALEVLREFHSELSPLDGASVEDQVKDALKWCVDEVDRCQRLLGPARRGEPAADGSENNNPEGDDTYW